MTRLLLRIYDYLERHKALMWTLLVVIAALCVLLSLRLHYEENIADFLPRDEANERYMDVYNGMGDQGQITVIFGSKEEDGDTNVELSAAEEEHVTDAIEDFEYYWKQVDAAEEDTMSAPLTCRMEDGRVFEAMDYIREHIGIMLTAADYRRADSLLALPNYIAISLANVKRTLSMPLSGIMAEGIANDPLNLFSPALQRLQALNVSDGYQMSGDFLFDKEGRHAFAFITSPYETSDTKGNARLSRRIDRVIDSTVLANAHVTVSAVGVPLIAVTNAQQIKKDSIWSILLAVLLILLILAVAVGYKRNLLWMAVSIVFGWLFALAVISLFKTSVSIIVIGIGSVLLGIAVNYPLHFMDHLADHPDRRATLKDMVEPLVTGNVTTVSAFACLLFVKAEAMRDLGLFGALMLVGTILFVMIFLPHIAKAGRKGRACSPEEEVVDDEASSLKGRRLARLAFLPVVLITVVLGLLSKHTGFDADLHNINYMTQQQQDDLQLLSRSLEQDTNDALVYLVAEAPTLDGALTVRERHAQALASSAKEAAMCKGATSLLPSLERQRQALQDWHAFQARHSQLRSQLEKEAVKAGFTPTAFAPFLQRMEASYDTVSPDSMLPLLSLASNFVLHGDTSVSVVDFIHTDKSETAEMKQAVSGLGDEALFAFDASDMGNSLVNTLKNDFNYILYMCGFVVFFFLWLSFANLELSLLSFLPLTIGWLWILGLMDVASVQFNIVNIILATFIFGQGDDYTIFITEGLLYENAYGRKRLRGYQRSVVLSALLMFVGMGALVISKHPAMRSLGIVAMIGMATVVLMACYLPPLIFRWMVEKKGRKRVAPITLKRLLLTGTMLLCYLLFTLFIFTPFTLIYRLIGRDTERKRARFHTVMWRCMKVAVRHIPGVHYEERSNGETFDKPAVIIANHQSHLDLLCMLALHPKLVIATNDWVWRNPIYSVIIRYAEFYPVSDGYQAHVEKLRSLVARGYSVVVFPEGTRSHTGEIQRFHKGAFQLAKDLHVELLPIYLYGTGQVMPKEDILLREGSITLEVGSRISAEELSEQDACELSRQCRHQYIVHYEELRRMLPSRVHWTSMVRYQYLYKGRDIWRRCRLSLRAAGSNADDFWPEAYHPQLDGAVIKVSERSQGELSLLFALLHPDMQVEASISCLDDYLVATHCALHPRNLSYVLTEEPQCVMSLSEKGVEV